MHVVVSLGTGKMPVQEVKYADVYRPEGLFDLVKVSFGARELAELMIDQVRHNLLLYNKLNFITIYIKCLKIMGNNDKVLISLNPESKNEVYIYVDYITRNSAVSLIWTCVTNQTFTRI